ncbi:unnamed protein product [Blepharisma stoltei]|uniref:Mitochondrial inner membrane protease ATP23 n=1 Tax=Blepharisma stoltei TaxID=1481888 RepID=A0AAU9JTR2_9CILI|nr:unnamed protein product [Blepharisma stoltei]
MDTDRAKLVVEAEVRNRLIAECIQSVNDYLHGRAWEIFSNKFKSMNINLPRDLIACKICEEPMTGHYFEKEKKIIICANNVVNQEFDSTLGHEMVHLFDDARAEVDFHNPEHVACSEIRATNLSGECSNKGFLKHVRKGTVTKKYTQCVKDRATKSLMDNPHFKLKNMMEAEEIVGGVWDVCFYDYEPFSIDEAKRKAAGKKF